jgi:hypothetical protein
VSLTTSSAPAQQIENETLFDVNQQSDQSAAIEKPSLLTSSAIVRQEANLLRFPLFALGRKGLRNHKGLLIRGQSKLDSQSYDFEYCITCNSNDLYPGQLARKVHMGLLRLMQSRQAFPFANPIEFTWRELMQTIGIQPGGRTVDQLKLAIRSIEGTRIRSKFALKNAEGKHLKSRERGYGLYSEYVFFDELMPDNETVASKNFVWLADWYLANINSLYCSPVDHALWQYLDDKSPIASRIYEFFTFNFAGDWQTLTIDYEKLARFLPVAAKKHLSQIEQQFETPLALAVQTGVLAQATWQRGKHGQPQLTVRRGRMLAGAGAATRWTSAPGEIDSTEIHELYRQSQPEDELVCQFYTLWSNDDTCRPTSAERVVAREIIAKYGAPHAEELLPSVVEIMRAHFPKAKSFGATRRYWPDAEKNVQHEQTVADRRKKEFIDHELDGAKALQEKADLARWQAEWNQLPSDRQQAIQQLVLSTNSPSLRLEKYPTVLHRFCLRELGKGEQNATAA